MKKEEVFATIEGVPPEAVVAWLVARVPAFADAKAAGPSIPYAEGFIRTFENEETVAVLQAALHDPSEIELDIISKTADAPFAGWDNIQLGKAIVDDLGGAALVDCRGKYTHPLSDEFVRVTRERLELVQFVDDGDETMEVPVRVIEERRT